MSVPLDQIPEAAQTVGIRLRDELVAILPDDLIAMLAHDGHATQEDVDLLATETAPFVAMVRDRVVLVQR